MRILVVFISAALVNNFVLNRFLGICPFLGVSKKTETAAGMGMAVVFVMALASAATYAAYNYILLPLGLEYLYNIAFILIIAGLVQLLLTWWGVSRPELRLGGFVMAYMVSNMLGTALCGWDLRKTVRHPAGTYPAASTRA